MHAVHSDDLAADLGGDALGCLFGVVLYFHFEEQVGVSHGGSGPTLYTKGMVCAICEIRRPRRSCPGVRGDICSQCCGTEREATVNCPLDCPYLCEARLHERLVPVDLEQVPDRDIEVSEEFLGENQDLVAFLARVLVTAALQTPGLVDSDAREALQSLVRTYRSLQSGLVYESMPANSLAAHLFRAVQSGVEEFRRQEREQRGMAHTRDVDVLGVLVFWERVEIDRNNARPRGRAFIDAIRRFYPGGAEVTATAASTLILP